MSSLKTGRDLECFTSKTALCVLLIDKNVHNSRGKALLSNEAV